MYVRCASVQDEKAGPCCLGKNMNWKLFAFDEKADRATTVYIPNVLAGWWFTVHRRRRIFQKMYT